MVRVQQQMLKSSDRTRGLSIGLAGIFIVTVMTFTKKVKGAASAYRGSFGKANIRRKYHLCDIRMEA
jgi:hypothetical protein